MQKTILGIINSGRVGEVPLYPGIINLSEKENDICIECGIGTLKKNAIDIKCSQIIVPKVPVLTCNYCSIDIVCKDGDEYAEKYLRHASFLYSVKKYQEKLSNEERVEFWDALKEDYCRFCGANNPTCQCNNDE